MINGFRVERASTEDNDVCRESNKEPYPPGKDAGDLDQSGHREDRKQYDELKRFLYYVQRQNERDSQASARD